jgi:hypothetical protein
LALKDLPGTNTLAYICSSVSDDVKTVLSPRRQNDDSNVRHTTPSIKIYDDHRDKQWSDLMLTNLLQCGKTATARQRAGEKLDLATILYDEWKKIYPCSTLTSRNLK